MDDNSNEYPLTDDTFGQPRFDRRRLIAAVTVSVLGVLVVVLATFAFASFVKHHGLDDGADPRPATSAHAAPRHVSTPKPSSSSGSGGGVCDDPELRQIVPDGFCSDAAPIDDPTPRTSNGDAGAERSAGATPDGWQRHDISSAGRSATMDAPSDWTEKNDEQGTFMLASPDTGNIAGVAAADYHGEPLDREADAYVEEVRTSYAPDLEVTDRGPATFAGRDSYRLDFTATYNGAPYNAEARFIVDGDTIWIAIWMHHSDAADGEDLAVRVLDSFQLPTSA